MVRLTEVDCTYFILKKRITIRSYIYESRKKIKKNQKKCERMCEGQQNYSTLGLIGKPANRHNRLIETIPQEPKLSIQVNNKFSVNRD